MKRILTNTELINIGRRGEKEARQVVFDISEWLALYGEGVATLVHQRCGDETPYPCVVEIVGKEALWTIAEADVDKVGIGECELIYISNGIVKSKIYKTLTSRSLSDASEEVPEAHQSWVDEVIKASASKSAYGIAVENGFEGTEEEWLESLVGPEGPQGYTPQREIDYWTLEDKVEIETYVDRKVNRGLIDLEEEIDSVEAIALGAEKSVTYADYLAMLKALLNFPKDYFKAGQGINIITLGVPDLWVAYVQDKFEDYVYESDEKIVETLSQDGFITVGYFVLAQRETQKVDLTDYAKKDQVPVINANLKDNGAYTLTITMGVE